MTLLEFIKETFMLIGICWLAARILKYMLMPFVWYKRRTKKQ